MAPRWRRIGCREGPPPMVFSHEVDCLENEDLVGLAWREIHRERHEAAHKILRASKTEEGGDILPKEDVR